MGMGMCGVPLQMKAEEPPSKAHAKKKARTSTDGVATKAALPRSEADAKVRDVWH